MSKYLYRIKEGKLSIGKQRKGNSRQEKKNGRIMGKNASKQKRIIDKKASKKERFQRIKQNILG